MNATLTTTAGKYCVVHDGEVYDFESEQAARTFAEAMERGKAQEVGERWKVKEVEA